jgi:hypothetical protein
MLRVQRRGKGPHPKGSAAGCTNSSCTFAHTCVDCGGAHPKGDRACNNKTGFK